LVKYSLTNSRNWIHVVSDVTLQVNMTPLTVEDPLLIKTLETENRWIIEKKLLLSFQRDSGNGIMLFAFLRNTNN